MGDPRKQRKKYSGPQHPWNRKRIGEERVLVEDYGLKNKKDLWKVTSKLTHFKKQAKALIVRRGEQAESEKRLFLEKLHRLNLVGATATIDDVLGLAVRDILERRLQTLVMRKGLAQSAKQARQFIVNGHISVNGQTMTVPSYLVPIAFGDAITFSTRSDLSDPEHPVRQVKKEPAPVVVEQKSQETENVTEVVAE